MKIGYSRISTVDQNLHLQKDALAKAACEKLFDDVISGAKSHRPGLEALLKFARKGDIIVVWRLDRLGRSMKDLISLVSTLEDKGIQIISLNESIDTSTGTGKLFFHIFGAIAEFERNLTIERTQAGLAAARARGRKGGRPKSLDKAKRELVVKLYSEKEKTVSEVCTIMGISKPTLYKYVEESALLKTQR
jgi:DNA invertase Pin-like site-specific DNA recombinase